MKKSQLLAIFPFIRNLIFDFFSGIYALGLGLIGFSISEPDNVSRHAYRWSYSNRRFGPLYDTYKSAFYSPPDIFTAIYFLRGNK